MSRGRSDIQTIDDLHEVEQKIAAAENTLGRVRLRFRDGDLAPAFEGWRAAIRLAEKLSLALWRAWEERDGYRSSQDNLYGRLQTLERIVGEQDKEITILRAVIQRRDGELLALDPDAVRVSEVMLYTDGACVGSGNRRRSKWRAGGGIVRLVEGRTDEWSIPFGPVNSREAEIMAIREGLLRVEDRPNSNVVIYTDSQDAIGVLRGHWAPKDNIDLIADTRQLARECRSCEFVKVKGHAGNPLNERADQLASLATEVTPRTGLEEQDNG